MQARYLDGLTIRSLRNGDTDTIAALFARLGDRSREKRFCGAKPRLSDIELHALARVDGDRHVLVGYVDGDSEPAAIARLVRDGTQAEVAFAVADVYQGRGIGSSLGRVLAADARAAGIRELVAMVCSDNVPMVSLLKRLGPLFPGELERPRAGVRGRARVLIAEDSGLLEPRPAPISTLSHYVRAFGSSPLVQYPDASVRILIPKGRRDGWSD